MNRYRILFLLLLVFVLWGCQADVPEATAPAPSTEATTIPTTVPPTTVPPTTEPEVLLEVGEPVYTDGDLLESGTVIRDGVTYLKLSEFLRALDGADYGGSEEEGYVLTRLGRQFRFFADMEAVLVDGAQTGMNAPVIRYQKAIWVPVEEICSLLDISYLYDEAGARQFCTSVGTGWDWERGVKIPILMYHGVSDDTWGASELFVSPANMEAQIKYLVENGYDLITFEDWGRLSEFDKPVMLTYDDGYRDNYEELFPILQKYNVKVTVFVITGSVDIHDTTLSYMQVRELAQSGLVSIQSHTYTHPHLDECGEEKLQQEHLQSKLMIARMTGYEPFVMCYPYGDRDEASLEVTREHYRFGLAMNGGLCTTTDNGYELPRYYVSRYTPMDEFIAMVSHAGT